MRERYSFTRRQSKCTVTEVPFEDDQVIYTAIFFGLEGDGYLRKDYSEQGWAQRPEEDLQPFSSWKSKWKKLEKIEDDQKLQKENAETLLARLNEEDRSESESTRYILALMLERSKIIVEEDSQEIPEGVLRVYRHRKTEEVILVKDPKLSLDEVAGLQVEVIRMLDQF